MWFSLPHYMGIRSSIGKVIRAASSGGNRLEIGVLLPIAPHQRGIRPFWAKVT
jgi:hypothetical protein